MSLVAVAQEHFSFFSAVEGGGAALARSRRLEDEAGGLGSRDIMARLESMEAMINSLADMVTTSNPPKGAKTKIPKAKATAKAAAKSGGGNAATKKIQFPHLDQGVVEAALQAGISQQQLAQMEQLVNKNSKALKVKDDEILFQKAKRKTLRRSSSMAKVLDRESSWTRWLHSWRNSQTSWPC